jgi:DNA-binding NarL/FixJ family response regulator
VLVVDDHRAFAEMLAIALQAGGMDVVGTAHSAAQAVSLA